MLYNIICNLFMLVFMTVFRWDVRGRENIPAEGPLIVCANHTSWWDPPLVGCIVWPRQVNFMAKEELFGIPVFGAILRRIKAFPVRRDTADRRAIKKALEVLSAGEVLGLFPEGTRSRTKELLPPQPGVGLIGLKSEAAVLPVAIVGPFKLFRPIRVLIGKKITFPEYYGQKARAEQLEQVAAQIMKEIAGLLKAAGS